MVGAAASAQTALHLTHEYANVDAQSLMACPWGSQDDRRPRRQSEVVAMEPGAQGQGCPIGFSAQMDAESGHRDYRGSWSAQRLSKSPGRACIRAAIPSLSRVSRCSSLTAEETAFAVVDHGTPMDVVWIEVKNPRGERRAHKSAVERQAAQPACLRRRQQLGRPRWSPACEPDARCECW